MIPIVQSSLSSEKIFENLIDLIFAFKLLKRHKLTKKIVSSTRECLRDKVNHRNYINQGVQIQEQGHGPGRSGISSSSSSRQLKFAYDLCLGQREGSLCHLIKISEQYRIRIFPFFCQRNSSIMKKKATCLIHKIKSL